MIYKPWTIRSDLNLCGVFPGLLNLNIPKNHALKLVVVKVFLRNISIYVKQTKIVKSIAIYHAYNLIEIRVYNNVLQWISFQTNGTFRLQPNEHSWLYTIHKQNSRNLVNHIIACHLNYLLAESKKWFKIKASYVDASLKSASRLHSSTTYLPFTIWKYISW